jgi:murein peptide amidase A
VLTRLSVAAALAGLITSAAAAGSLDAVAHPAATVVSRTALTTPDPSAARPAVIERRILGYSAKGRPIKAWRLGKPGKPRFVVISTMHGNERSTKRILTSLRDGRPIRGIDLWVVPVYNPDGYARGTRKNGRGVDLNRNYPRGWVDLDGSYESGSGPASEPETAAMMKFLAEIKPRRIVSFHQPLNGVDVDTKKPRFARRLARALNLPRTSLDCGGVCHGTMTSWYNAKFKGAALTVEYGYRPSRQRMRVQAPRALLRVLGGRR